MSSLLSLLAALTLAAVPVPVSPSASWVWPAGDASAVLASYAAPAHRYAAGHRGIDIAVASGGTVVSPASGTVHFAGFVVDRPVLTIRTEDGTLASMEPVAAVVAAGQVVSAGQIVGTVSAGTHCLQSCVHFSARSGGDYVSPLRFLGALQRAVLLPMK